jgi:hypothetical protein
MRGVDPGQAGAHDQDVEMFLLHADEFNTFPYHR